MLFYRAKEEPHWMAYRAVGVVDYSMVKGELFTARELERFGFNRLMSYLEPVEISKRATYWCFGRRYAFADLDNRE